MNDGYSDYFTLSLGKTSIQITKTVFFSVYAYSSTENFLSPILLSVTSSKKKWKWKQI